MTAHPSTHERPRSKGSCHVVARRRMGSAAACWRTQWCWHRPRPRRYTPSPSGGLLDMRGRAASLVDAVAC
eukprot:1118115-Pyramimonas_sp.AAC.1